MASDLHAIVEKLNKPIRVDDATERVKLCLQALALFDREEDPPLWADLHIILGNNLTRSPYDRSAQSFAEAVGHFEQALHVYTKEKYPRDWAFIHTKLGDLCRTTSSEPRDDMLVQATLNYQKALEVYNLEENSSEWAMINANLALCFQSMVGDINELKQAIHHYRQALIVYTLPEFPRQWAIVHHNLGDVYRNLFFDDSDRGVNIEQALTHYNHALQIYNQQQFPEEWASLQVKIANLLVNRFAGERADNLELAIKHFHLALQVRTQQTHPVQWASAQNDLATAYLMRIAGERKDNLERALYIYRQALSIFNNVDFPDKWAMVQSNLGELYRNRIVGNRADNLEEAIYCFNQSLHVRNREITPEDWAMTQSNLGETYRYRIVGERAANLEKSIEHLIQALDVLAQGEKQAKVQNNLAAAFKDRIAGRRSENLIQAIHNYRQAQRFLTREEYPLEWAIIQQNMAVAFNDLSLLNYEAESSSEEALLHCRQALEVLTQQDFPEDWAMVHASLGSIYSNRVSGDRIKNLQLAEEHYYEALKVYTFESFPEDWASVQNDLGCIYADLVRYGQNQYLERAIGAFGEALEVRKIDRFPGQYQQTQRNLGDLYFAEKQWAEAGKAAQAAITAGNLMFDVSYTEVGRQAEVEAVAQLYAHTAYCLWRLNQPTAALHQLEQGKTRLLAEALSLGEVNLAQLPIEQRQRLREAQQKVASLEAEMRLPLDTPSRQSEKALTEMLHDARVELRRELATIELAHPDYLPSVRDVPTILSLIPPGGVLVAPFITSQGGAAFVIPYGTKTLAQNHILPLPQLTTSYLSELLQGPKDVSPLSGWLNTYRHFIEEPVQTTQDAWFQVINTVTGHLWDSLMGPIHHLLQKLNLGSGAPVLLIPQGGLGLLPLHAAWCEMEGHPRYFSDDYTVTYAPSAYALLISLQRATQPARQARSLFAAINPTQNLPYTPVEGDAIAQLFPAANQTILRETEAAAATFPAKAQGHAYIHYAGHGRYNWRNPIQSSLQLADKPYTLADILSGLDLSACRLVTLSACETGITEFQQAPDEYVGLPAGFLQAGAPAVISTLWAVNDLSTMLLMERFYQLHLQDGLAMAPALRQGQLWLRKITAGELTKRFGEERMKVKDNRLPLAEVSEYWRRFATLEPYTRPFIHPHYWAAFTFTGT